MNRECRHPIAFFASNGAPDHCPECNALYAEKIGDALDTDPITYDNYNFRSPINCPYCIGYHTVVAHYHGYVCTDCFEYETEVGFCGWCNEGQLGNVGEFSELSGCEFCEGRAGHDKD